MSYCCFRHALGALLHLHRILWYIGQWSFAIKDNKNKTTLFMLRKCFVLVYCKLLFCSGLNYILGLMRKVAHIYLFNHLFSLWQSLQVHVFFKLKLSYMSNLITMTIFYMSGGYCPGRSKMDCEIFISVRVLTNTFVIYMYFYVKLFLGRMFIC